MSNSFGEKEGILWFKDIATNLDKEEEEYLNPKKTWASRPRGMNMKEYIRRRAFAQEKIFFTSLTAPIEAKTHELYLWIQLQMRS